MLPVGVSFIGAMIFPVIVDVLRAKNILSTTATRKIATATGEFDSLNDGIDNLDVENTNVR